MPKVQKVCECGRAFSVYPSLAGQEHCSQACSSRFKPRKARTGVQATCEVCGTVFYRNPIEARKGRGRFCSRDCHNVAQAKEPVLKSCESCGAEMRLKPSQSARRYCSKACEGAGRIVRPLDRTHNGRPAKQDHYGYVMVWEPEHPNKSMKGWQYEHRVVMERAIGRYLQPGEHVDHINGVKDDNRLDNLQVLSHSDHSKKTIVDRRTASELLRAELAEYRRRFGPLDKEV